MYLETLQKILKKKLIPLYLYKLREAASKIYVNKIWRKDIDFNDVKLENYKFVKVTYQLAVNEHLTPKTIFDNAINDLSLLRNNKDNNFNNYNLTKINSIFLNKQAEHDNAVITKAYVDQFHPENERLRRDVRTSFYDEASDLVKSNQDNDLNDNKLTNLDSFTVNWNPTSDNEVSNKKYIQDDLDKNTVLRFDQTLQNYPKVSVGNDTYKLTEYEKTKITDTTITKYPKSGGYLLQNEI